MIKDLISRYLNLEPEKSLNLQKISNSLDVSFSKECYALAEKSRFDYLDCFSWLSFDGDEQYSVVSFTKYLQANYKLPKDTLVLADDGASYVFMKCFGDHEEFFWIASYDLANFCQGKPLEYDYDHFPTFEAFFEFLLDEEEKMRKEESNE